MATVEQSRQVSPENLFPKDVLPTVAFLSKLQGVYKEYPSEEIVSWGGELAIGTSKLSLGVGFRPEIRKADFAGVRHFAGRETHVNVKKRTGERDYSDDLIERWTILENPKKSELIVFLMPNNPVTMLLPDPSNRLRPALKAKLVFSQGKLASESNLLTEKDVDRKKSHANYWYYQKKVAPASLEEIFEAMGALKNAILSARPTED